MNLFGFTVSSNFAEKMGLDKNIEEIKKDLTWTPLPSGPEVWEEGKQNGEKMKEEIKQKGAEMALDLLPAGGAVGTTKDITTKLGKKIKLVFDPEEGRVLAKTADGREVGELNIAPLIDYKLDPNIPSQAAWMGVEKDFRREGINTEMNKWMMELFPQYTPISHTLTEMGEAWARKVPASFKERDTSVREVLRGLKTPKATNDFFGMHKSTELGDVVLTRSAKDPSKFQMTLFDGKLGSSNTVKDMQFDTREEAMKAFEEQ